ncbi:MAG TPA: hypothetical protein PKB10_11040, partial [Tepidisphaeraceae bacterium]|nr:hypothetical protein [Tepidisphaeraceae bacterium]
MTRQQVIAQYPDFPFLSVDDPERLQTLLLATGAMDRLENLVAIEIAGQGNMNLTLRAEITGPSAVRSLVVKQSRPWVEKYDSIAAPWDRALVEARFYDVTRNIPAVANRMPKLIAVEYDARALILEDLGPSSDLTSVYQSHELDDAVIDELADYLRALHDETHGKPAADLANRDMRQLNHAHQYVIPLDPDCPVLLEQLEPGLSAAAKTLREDHSYRRRVDDTAHRYLADGQCLLHGDFFFGRFLRTTRGVMVIDPEICYF